MMAVVAGSVALAQSPSSSPASPVTPPSVAVPGFVLPPSSFSSPEAIALLERQAIRAPLPPGEITIQTLRDHNDRQKEDALRRMREIYSVNVTSDTLGGVAVQRITPTTGVARNNRRRVLINLHGGGFLWGAGNGSLLESIPIAAVGQIEVISVDYRMAPEHRFPAASEDVAAVYQALLTEYSPRGIGIYGCSAGGFLTAQSVAWFLDRGLPTPGAIGTFCASVVDFGGDSMYLAEEMRPGNPAHSLKMIDTPYFIGARGDDPLAFPGVSSVVLSRFPPTLLITSTRDYAMSSVVRSNVLLNAADVKTELHIWDGLPHGFFSDPDLEESRQVYQTVTRFFDRSLAIDQRPDRRRR